MSTARIALALTKGLGAGIITGLSHVGMLEILTQIRGTLDNQCYPAASRLVTDSIVLGVYALLGTPVWATYFYLPPTNEPDAEAQPLLEPDSRNSISPV